MGQKINPIGLRLQVNRTWDSRWFADGKDYGKLLHEDLAIREFIKKNAGQAGISRVVIERPHRKCRVTIHAARPGVIIGKKGADIEVLRKKLAQFTKSELHLNIVEVRKPEIDAAAGRREHRPAARAPGVLPPRDEARGAERRCAWARSASGSTSAGRLGGAEIARVEWYREGRVPLHTLRADIDYALCEAKTAYGIIGDQGLDLQGRDPRARSAGARPPPGRTSGRAPDAAAALALTPGRREK